MMGTDELKATIVNAKSMSDMLTLAGDSGLELDVGCIRDMRMLLRELLKRLRRELYDKDTLASRLDHQTLIDAADRPEFKE